MTGSGDCVTEEMDAGKGGIGKTHTSLTGMKKSSGGDDAATGSGGCVPGELGDGLEFGKPNTSMAGLKKSSGGDSAATGSGGCLSRTGCV